MSDPLAPNPVASPKPAIWLDRLGIAMSMACWVHCLVLPLLVLLSPSLSSILLGDSSFHVVLLFVILPIAVTAFTLGWLKHRSRTVLILGGFGLLLIMISSLQAALMGHGVLSESLEKIITSLGGLFLATGHFLNMRKQR